MQTRSLRADDNLILDVIRRQAGTLAKAVLEGVMNALEAGSPFINIELTYDGIEPNKPGAVLKLTDDGQGFRNEQEIIDWFETFGKPHTDGENKIWADFRMGRGQLFSFGKNIWRTGQFRMTVDIKANGLQYQLEKGLSEVRGCEIIVELYQNPIGSYEYPSSESFVSAIRKQIEFIEGKVCFNGVQINTPASSLQWDIEDDDALYMFGKGIDLSLYNMGAYVMSWSPFRAGVTGVVVSKRKLKVNFARNDIQSDCEVYGRIQKVIKANRTKKVRKVTRHLTHGERVATLCDLRDCQCDYRDIKNIGLIPTSSGKMMTLESCAKICSYWTFAPMGDRIADKLLQANKAICLADRVLDELDYRGDPKNFWTWLCGSATSRNKWENLGKLFRPFKGSSGESGLADSISGTSTILPFQQLTVVERRILKVLNDYRQWSFWGNRTICIGISDAYSGWTDGRSYICLDRNYLKRCRPNQPRGAADVIHTLFHEWAHDDDSVGSHIHGEEFFNRFHELTSHGNLWIIEDITHRLRKSRLDEKQAALEERELRAKKARDKKLGLDAPQEAIAAKVVVKPQVVSKRVVGPGGKYRRHRRI